MGICASECVIGIGVSGCVIDWVATGSMLQGVGTIAGAVAVIWAANKGTDTYASWRKQQFSGRRFAEAERILTATYNAQNALKYVRGPLVEAAESIEAKDMLEVKPGWSDISDIRKERLISAQVFHNRMNRVLDIRNSLLSCSGISNALFDENLKAAIEKLNSQFNIIYVNIRSYEEDYRELNPNFTQQIRRALVDTDSGGEDKNIMTENITKSVSIIESYCLPILRMTE